LEGWEGGMVWYGEREREREIEIKMIKLKEISNIFAFRLKKIKK